MGNSNSVLYIRLDHDNNNNNDTEGYYCQAGTTLQGRVSLDLSSINVCDEHTTTTTNRNQQKDETYQLVLSLIGKEKVVLRSKLPSSHRGSHAERPFLTSKRLVLCEFHSQQTLVPGWHDFPFSIPVPSTMPSSMRYDLSTSCYCSIEYKLKAELLPIIPSNNTNRPTTSSFSSPLSSRALLQGVSSSSSSISSSFTHRNLKVQHDFMVCAQPQPAELVPFFVSPQTISVKSFGLVSKGTVSFGVSLVDTHVSRGEVLEICVAACNDSLVDLECVYISLMERVTCSTIAMMAKEEESSATKTTQSSEDSGDLLQASSSSIINDGSSSSLNNSSNSGMMSKRRSTEVSLAESVMMDLREEMQSREDVWYTKNITGLDNLHSENEQHIYLDLHAKKHVCKLQVPTTALDSYRGPLIKVEHYLKLKVKTSAMVDDPVVHVPLMLLNYSNEHVLHATATVVRRSTTVDEGELTEIQEEEAHEEKEEEAKDGDEDAALTDACGGAETEREEQPLARIPPLIRTGPDEYRLPPTTRMAPRVQHVREYIPPPSPRTNTDVGDDRRPSITAPRFQVPVADIRTGGLDIMRESLTSVNAGGSATSFGSFDASRTILMESFGEGTPAAYEAAPSLENLLKQMHASMNDFEIIQSLVEESDEWRVILTTVTPEDFGSIIAHVNIDMDQPKVAAYLAGQISAWGDNDNSKFTCQHCTAALSTTADWNRVNMIQRLLPFCTDLETNQHVLTQELTPWELTLTAEDFAAAMTTTSALLSSGRNSYT